MDITSTQLIDSLLLPPGGPLLLALIGLLLWKGGFGRRLFVFALLLQWTLSLPFTEHLLFAGLERYPPLDETRIEQEQPEAIVLLGAAHVLNAAEYGEDTAGPHMLMRARYAAKLAKKLGLPIIPSGGVGHHGGLPGARIYAKILREEFGVPVEHIEPRSHSTWENARYTAQLLKTLGIQKVILVTDAGHMLRSVYAFERNGVKVIPGPTGFINNPDQGMTVSHLLPNANAMRNIAYALHEYLGMLRYQLY